MTLPGNPPWSSRKELLARAAVGMPAFHPELVTRKPRRAEWKHLAQLAGRAVALRRVHRDRRRGMAQATATGNTRLEVIAVTATTTASERLSRRSTLFRCQASERQPSIRPAGRGLVLRNGQELIHHGQ